MMGHGTKGTCVPFLKFYLKNNGNCETEEPALAACLLPLRSLQSARVDGDLKYSQEKYCNVGGSGSPEICLI